METQLSKSSLRTSRKLYDATKNKVIELEKQNTSRIIAFQSDAKGEWYKIGGNSLLLYYFEICQKILNLHPTIQPDTDFSSASFPEGVICIRGLTALEKRLSRAQVLKAKRAGGHTVVYELSISLPLETLDKLRTDLIASREQALSVVRPKITLDPEAYDYIRRLERRTYEEVRKLSPFDRDFIGSEATRFAHRMTVVYFDMNAGLTDESSGWAEIYAIARRLSYDLNTLTDLKICPISPLTRIWSDCINLLHYIKRTHLKNQK